MVKVGFRKPSLKKSISARTKGRATRAMKKAVIPGYGQKGMGWAHPKRKLYNEVYQRTTVDTRKVVADAMTSSKKQNKVQPIKSGISSNVTKFSKVNTDNQKESVKVFKTAKGLHRAKAIKEVAGWSIWLSPLFRLPVAVTILFLVFWILMWFMTVKE